MMLSHQPKIATLCTSKGSSSTAPGIAASVSSTGACAETALVDGLLFASISSGAALTWQNIWMRQAITALLSPRCFPRSVLFLYIHFISINGGTRQWAQFKLTTICIYCNGEVLHEWTPELTLCSLHTLGVILMLSINYNAKYVSSIVRVRQVDYVHVELISENMWITFLSYNQPSWDCFNRLHVKMRLLYLKLGVVGAGESS